jgi:hypothetical protein
MLTDMTGFSFCALQPRLLESIAYDIMRTVHRLSKLQQPPQQRCTSELLAEMHQDRAELA